MRGEYKEGAGALLAWRSILRELAVVGRRDDRYGGAGFGNLSARLNPPSSRRGHRRFLITGSQTGGVPNMTLEQFCVVESYDHLRNFVCSKGEVAPSSESLTHGAIYDMNPAIRFVFHGHSPEIWREAGRLRLPTTDASIPYGTSAMAHAVEQLYRTSSLAERGVLAMAGHEDGILSFGRSAQEAGLAMIRELAKARALSR